MRDKDNFRAIGSKQMMTTSGSYQSKYKRTKFLLLTWYNRHFIILKKKNPSTAASYITCSFHFTINLILYNLQIYSLKSN